MYKIFHIKFQIPIILKMVMKNLITGVIQLIHPVKEMLRLTTPEEKGKNKEVCII